MTFYNQDGQEIDQETWINTYEPYYFLNGPTLNRRISGRNQSSQYVEDRIEKILKRGLESAELPLVIAWKIGAINHRESESQHKIVYRQNFEETLRFAAPFPNVNTEQIIEYCTNNFDRLKTMAQNNQIEQLFQELYDNSGQGIGPINCISLIYFFSQGEWPICDRFAYTAAKAILNDSQPGQNVAYGEINHYNRYNNHYVEKITKIFNDRKISRKIDRSLWAYGHFFNINR